MKIALIVISNRPAKLKRFLDSLAKFPELASQVVVAVTAQGNPEHYQHLVGKYQFRYMINVIKQPEPPVPFVWLRKSTMNLLPDADFYWSLDDDHQFCDANPNNTLNKTVTDYYTEIFSLLRSRPEIGAVSSRGYFGGYAWGYDIRLNPSNGLVATDAGGIILRNIGVDKIIEPDEEHLVGALFESLAIYNIMSHGYKLARRFNSPVKFEPPGAGKHIGGSNNISYSDKIVEANIQKRIREKFNDPGWTHSSKKYPRGVL